MCIDPLTLTAIAKGASTAGLVLSSVQGFQNAKSAEAAAKEKAKAQVRQGIVEQEQQNREERYRQGAEVQAIAASGISGSYGSPFVMALRNAENAAMGSISSGRAYGQAAASTRAQGAAQAQGYRSQAFGNLVSAADSGVSGYQAYDRARQNRIYLSGNTLPGVV